MNTNLEALVEAASGAHPIPDKVAEGQAQVEAQAQSEAQAQAQSEAQAQAYAHAQALAQAQAQLTEPNPVETPLTADIHAITMHEPNPVETSVTDAVVAMQAQMHEPNPVQTHSVAEAVAVAEAVVAMEHIMEPTELSIVEVKGDHNELAYSAASTAAAEANAAAAAAVAAVEATTILGVKHVDPIPVPAIVPALQLPQDEKNELAKNMPGSRIVERRRKGWVKKTWEERLEELKEYKKVHGNANVPTLSKENPSLGHWVHDQRKQYRLFNEKKQTAMTPSRIEQLEIVGFKWALQRHTTMKSWNERFEELKSYKLEKGNCNVPIRYKNNPSLGQWVSTQRQEYGAKKKGNKTNITAERIKALEEVGFVWSLRDTSKMAPRKTWDAHFQSLKDFKEKNGHCDVRVRSKQHPTGSLGRWVEKQRHHYNSRVDGKESKISDEQIEKLEDLGFKWRVRNEKRSVIERREKMKAEAEAVKVQKDVADAAEAKAQEETAAAVAAEVAASVEATVEAVGIDHGLSMPPVPGMHVPLDVTGATSMDVDMNHVTVAAVDAHIVDAQTAAAMEASVQAAVDASVPKMDFDGVQVPVLEPAHVPEITMNDPHTIPAPELTEGTLEVSI